MNLLTRAKFDRITAWINQTADGGRCRSNFVLIDVSVDIYFFQEKWTLVSSHQDIWLSAVIRRKKIIYLLFFLSFFILLVRTHLHRYTFIAKITAIYRCKKHSRISKGANQRNSVLWNAFCSLYHLFAFLSQRDDADVVPWVGSVTFLWLLKLIVFLNNCTIKSSEVDCLLDICYNAIFLEFQVCHTVYDLSVLLTDWFS